MASKLSQLFSHPPNNVDNQLLQYKNEYPNLADQLDILQKLYSTKLYHDLSEAVLAFVCQNNWETFLDVELVYTLLYPLNGKININRLCDVFIKLTDRLDPDDQLALVDKFETMCSIAFMSNAVMEIIKAEAYIKKNEINKAYEILFVSLSKTFENQISIDIKVNTHFHMCCIKYYRATKDLKKIYHHLVLYVAYTPLDEIPLHIREELAFEACACGLIAEDMFDFGDLLSSPLLTCLESPDKKWIIELLENVNEGNYQKITNVCEKYKTQLQSLFGYNLTSFKIKITLIVFLELAFQQPKSSHFLTFEQIHKECFIPMEEVELLLIKAINLNLIKGLIDQVDQRIDLIWVKPRMIDLTRVARLKEQFGVWEANVKTLVKELETSTNELFAV